MGGGEKSHTRGESRETGSRNGTKRGAFEMETSTKYRMPLTVIGMAVEKSSISRGAGAGQAALWTRFHFPRKTPPIRGLREADRFILGRIQADQFVPRFARELESPIVTDRLNGLSLSSATNLENRIFHRPHRIVFATFENDMDYDFDSDSMGMVFFVLCLPLRRFSFERWSVFGKRLKNLAIVWIVYRDRWDCYYRERERQTLK